MSEFYVIDTNVFVAPTKQATHISPQAKNKASAWLANFRDNEAAWMLIDSTYPTVVGNSEIIWEYERNLQPKSLGWEVIKRKLNGRFLGYKIEFDGETKGIRKAKLPGALQQIVHDPSDRKFVAVALRHVEAHGQCTIVVAVDRGWAAWRASLIQHGINIQWII